MNVTCPECQSIFRVDPAKVPATGVRARCSVCGGIITITGGTLTTGVPQPQALAEARAATPAVARPVTPQTVQPAASVASAISQPAAAAIAQPAALQMPPVAVPLSPSGSYATSEAQGAVGAVGSSGARRSINPFLNADPSLRARRLARALVSDLVAYHPQQREEGLRNGTLRQLFKEEIKKSYEEFTEQVGRETAESSTYFQDALNEVLAGGQRIF